MNDREAASLGAEALEYHVTWYDWLCDRWKVTWTSSFEFCFTETTSDEKTQGNSLGLDMVLLTRKTTTGSFEAWSIFFFFFFLFWAALAETTVTIVHWEKECSKFFFFFLEKNTGFFKTNVNFSLYSSNIFFTQQLSSKIKTFLEREVFLLQKNEEGHCILFWMDCRPTLRASFEVSLCPIFKTNTPLQSPCH